jgi:hypothetical protein
LPRSHSRPPPLLRRAASAGQYSRTRFTSLVRLHAESVLPKQESKCCHCTHKWLQQFHRVAVMLLHVLHVDWHQWAFMHASCAGLPQPHARGHHMQQPNAAACRGSTGARMRAWGRARRPPPQRSSKQGVCGSKGACLGPGWQAWRRGRAGGEGLRGPAGQRLRSWAPARVGCPGARLCRRTCRARRPACPAHGPA